MESLKYQEEISTKEKIRDLKSTIEEKNLRDNPRKALFFWLAEHGNILQIYPPMLPKDIADAEIKSEDDSPKLKLQSSSIIEDNNFNATVEKIKNILRTRTSLHTMEEVLGEIDSLPLLILKYVDPDGNDFKMKFKFKHESDGFKMSPFVSGSESTEAGAGFDIENENYDIVGEMQEDYSRKYHFKKINHSN